MKGIGRIFLCLFALAAFVAAPADLFAQDGRGEVEGRVKNVKTGAFLSSARVKVEGTAIETLTDNDGFYHLRNVPEGDVNIVVDYTGTKSRIYKISVSEGQIVELNPRLIPWSKNLDYSEIDDEDVFELAPFEVEASKEFDARMLASNEERFSTNLKNVVSTDAFGAVPQGNVGEFVKFMPGVQVNYGGGSYGNGADATSISIRGFGADQTSVTIDGVEIAGATPGSMTRAVGLDMMSINNASRVELVKVPTPDMPSDAIGGQINLVSKSAFEYAKPRLSWSAYFNVNSENLSSDFMFGKTPGPGEGETWKMKPSYSFSYALPVNEKFGLTLNAAVSNQFDENHNLKLKWKDDFRRTNEDTGLKNDVRNPYLEQVSITDDPRSSERKSYSAKFDYAPTDAHSFTFNVQTSTFSSVQGARRFQIDARNPDAWGDDYTIGTGGQLAQEGFMLDRDGDTLSSYLKYKFDQGPWEVSAVASHSKSEGELVSGRNGHFTGLEVKGGNLGYIEFHDIANGVPGTIIAMDKQGNAYDWGDINNFEIDPDEQSDGGTDLTVLAGEAKTTSIRESYKVDIRRELDFIPSDAMQLAFKTGFHRRVFDESKSGKGTNYKYRYIGPSDAFNPELYYDDSYSGQNLGYGVSGVAWVDPYKLWTFFEDNPDYWSDTQDVANGKTIAANNYEEGIKNIKGLRETDDSFYAMLEGKFFSGKLNIVTGVRDSKKKREGYEPYRDTNYGFVKNELGQFITYQDSEGSTQRIDMRNPDLWESYQAGNEPEIEAALASSGQTWDELVVRNTLSQATREWKTYYTDGEVDQAPTYSWNMAYDINHKWKARFAWSKTSASPDFEDTLNGNRVEIHDNVEDPGGKIKIGNPSLEPWTSNNYDFSVSYYNERGGKLTLTYYEKHVENFYKNISEGVTPELIAQLSLPDFDDIEFWTVETRVNGEGTAKTSGYEIDFNQDLSILGDWGRNVSWYASYGTKSTTQEDTDSLVQTPDDSAASGVAVRIGKFSANVKGTYRSETIRKNNSGRLWHANPDRSDSETIQYYTFTPSEERIDVNLNYQINDKYGIFFNAANITDTGSENIRISDESERIGAEGMWPAYAMLQEKRVHGFNMTFGVNGRF
ncbi:TonB-dependent receptor [Pelagicoccus sp. NFK12]|uniref:TonB-dependent receptor n=1 Tax=Pelagicoccus enzymogenes TaxID=2773457 RepID=A0A927F758_9BACT|nr:TonB-dependent receptor [Pelagicoccus enzymogenes]MBD5779104.1 TonB-dependent receptor [Pelagicoccus enzymogenes]